jgi:hypothetical protein
MRIPRELPHRTGSPLCRRVLEFLTGPTQLGFFVRRRLRGIELHDDDTGKTWGHGEPIRGPGVAVMLAARTHCRIRPSHWPRTRRVAVSLTRLLHSSSCF